MAISPQNADAFDPNAQMAAEFRRGPNQPQASHLQIKTIERILHDFALFNQRQHIGAPYQEHSAFNANIARCAHDTARDQILECFGFGQVGKSQA